MINHLRTLLLNEGPADADYPGEEYVPKDFRTQGLPHELIRIRNLLFGLNPDRAMLNYRLRQYMTLLHTTELEEYVTALDPRVTYWPPHDTQLFKESAFGTAITQLAGVGGWGINITGNPTEIKNNAQLLSVWRVEVLDNTSVRVNRLTQPETAMTYVYTLTNGVSENIPLIGSAMSFMLTAAAPPFPSWEVRHTARPLLDLSDVYAGLRSGLTVGVESLFLPLSEQPYRTCHELWSLESGPIAYKLGAVILALGYKLHSLYTHSYEAR